jgi:DNA-binding MarR family transcriptional regulator
MHRLGYPHTYEIILEIEESLRKITHLMKQKNRELLQQFNITPPQFLALQWLYEEGELTIGDLSSKMFLACSTITDLIDRMERHDLVERVRDTSDRRVVRLYLRPKGKQLFEEIVEAKRTYLSRILETYSPEEVQRLGRFLKRLYQDLSLI